MKQSTLINNRDKAKQLLAFDGMKYGLCRPTDIDISMDFQQKCFVFVELKTLGAPLTTGQKVHLQGLVDAIVAGGKQATAILAHHSTPECEHDVHCAESVVHSVYTGGRGGWEKIHPLTTLNDFIKLVHETYRSSRG